MWTFVGGFRGRPENEPYTNTILLTGKRQKHEMLEAMNAGADDFLAKPFDPPEPESAPLGREENRGAATKARFCEQRAAQLRKS